VIRLYGEFEGESSLCRVAQGFASVFPDSPRYELDRCDNGLDDSEEVVPGATAKYGVFVGPLQHIRVLGEAKHECNMVMVAPNSSTVGPVLKHALQDIEVLLAPSLWAKGVLQEEFPGKKVLCVPHGIDPRFTRAEVPPKGPKTDSWKALHMSSSELERKGTDLLIKAWAEAKFPSNAVLYLSVPAGRMFDFMELADDLGVADSVKVTDRLDYSPKNLAALYSNMDLVCQPSRGEGFGLVPLEARACGTPALLTHCTGHSQHAIGSGIALIDHGPLAPIDDFPGAVAPSVSVEQVAEGLCNAYSNRLTLSSEAQKVAGEIRKYWSWENQLKEFKNVINS